MGRRFLTCLAVVMLVALPAFGGLIADIGLFNTGVGSHYTGYSGVSSAAFTPVVVSPVSGTWLPNTGTTTGTSSWIGPVADYTQTLPNSTDSLYSYQISFDLTGRDSTTFSLGLGVAGDNVLWSYLNLNQIAACTAGDGTWAGLTSCTISGSTTGLLPGVNTLTFNVTNLAMATGDLTAYNPTGLRVQFSSEFTGAEANAVPEPATVGLIGAGLLALGLFRKRS